MINFANNQDLHIKTMNVFFPPIIIWGEKSKAEI